MSKTRKDFYAVRDAMTYFADKEDRLNATQDVSEYDMLRQLGYSNKEAAAFVGRLSRGE